MNLNYIRDKSPKKTIVRLLTEPYLCVSRIKRFKNFRLFVHNYLNLQPFSSLEKTSKELDCLILGSDQIWSPAVTGGVFDPVFWGANANCKVVTYAASTRLEAFTSEQSDFIKRHIGNLSHISVREGHLKELLQKWGASNKRMAALAILTFALVALVAWVEVIKPYIDAKKAAKEIAEAAQ